MHQLLCVHVTYGIRGPSSCTAKKHNRFAFLWRSLSAWPCSLPDLHAFILICGVCFLRAEQGPQV